MQERWKGIEGDRLTLGLLAWRVEEMKTAHAEVGEREGKEAWDKAVLEVQRNIQKAAGYMDMELKIRRSL